MAYRRCGLGIPDWWNVLSEEQQDDVAHSVRHLIEFKPALGFPHSSRVGSSRYPQMRELWTQSAGRPLRTLYAFNSLPSAILNDTCSISVRRDAFNAHSKFP